MTKRNAIKTVKNDILAKALSLENGEVLTDNDELYYLTNFKKNRIYENTLFIKETLVQNIEITGFTLLNNKPLSFFEEYISLLVNNEQFKELSNTDNELQGFNGNVVSVIHSLLQSKYQVEMFKQMEGLFNSTQAFFYIDEIRTVIVHNEMSSEDILNLLSIKDLNVYIYSLKRKYTSEGYLIKLELYKIKLKNKTAYRLIKEEFSNRQKEEVTIKRLIKSISPSHSNRHYLSIDDKEDLCTLYQSIPEVIQRHLQHFILNTRGDEAIQIVSSCEPLLKFLSDKIVSADLLLQSYRNLISPQKNANDDEAIHFNHGKHYNLKKFTNYNLLVKDFNSRYREFHKWMKEWYQIVKEAEGDKPPLLPNKDSIYYKIAAEVAERLSTLWFISEVRLFGSVAKGQEKEGSDIDIAYKVGIDIKDLTIARRETMHRVVKYEVQRIENKYEALVEQSLDKKYGKDKGNIRRFLATDKLIDLLPIQFQKKRHQKQYEELNFFKDSVVLLQRDSFKLDNEGSTRIINYPDIEHVLFPTNDYYSFIINKKVENDDVIIYEYIKFDYIKDEVNYVIDYIAYQIIEKAVGYSRPQMELGKAFKHKDIFNGEWGYRSEYFLIEDGLSGGIVRLNPTVPYIYSYNQYHIQRQKKENP